MRRKLGIPKHTGPSPPVLAKLVAIFAVASLLTFLPGLPLGMAAEIQDAYDLFRQGEYAASATLAGEEIERGSWQEGWRLVKAEAELAQGKYAEAMETVELGLDLHPFSVPLRLLARDVYRYNGKYLRADAVLSDLERFVSSSPRRYRSPAERVALGRFLLERGADARQVLELVYDQVREQSPELVEVYLAIAELALEKSDYAVAADTLRAAPEGAAEDPRYHFLTARAFAADDPPRAALAIEAALKLNPRHAESLLFRAEQAIDAEQYAEAERALEKIFRVNPYHPTAWAYKAVLAHLTGKADIERQARKEALAHWSTNPAVDHHIGRKLSQKYRFTEGAAYQRRALDLDADYRPAKMQLSQDLLRLGEEEGWRLANEVANEDAYDVLAYNLVTLQQAISKFRTLERKGLVVRMEAREAELYGGRVLDLLERARDELCEKYEVNLPDRIFVEIFPEEKDFAVRTFGMPGIGGFLGVCFGRVITANSPASQGERPANWEAVLWHEFCHVVTLQKTRNKMPRWLSEGISVYEERQADPTWGQSMNPQYREMILGDDLVPVSELSSAFLSPKSPLHLQFAYFESSLVVEYLIERYGLESLKAILDDLYDDVTINEALVRHTAPLGRLNADFARFARDRAQGFAPGATWEKLELPPDADADLLRRLLAAEPTNYWLLQRLAGDLLRQRDFAKLVEVAEQLRALDPEDASLGNAYALLARAHRELKNEDAERIALETWAERAADASQAYLRLIELAEAREDWPGVARNARRMLAVNPLVPVPHRSLARAAEKLGERQDAIQAYRALLQFDSSDPAEAHFRLASLLKEEERPQEAKRQALLALEEAPRYLAAHRLLLELVQAEDAAEPAGSTDAASETDATAESLEETPAPAEAAQQDTSAGAQGPATSPTAGEGTSP